jgi:hypothetical protein
MGKRDYYKKGDWNSICYVCGFKRKASEMKLRWDGVYVCAQDWEIRQPQDFVRGVPEEEPLPWTQPEPPDGFVSATEIGPFTNIVVGTPTIFVNSTPVTSGVDYTIELPEGIITFITQYAPGSVIAWSGTWKNSASVNQTYTQRTLYLWQANTSIYQIYGTQT